MLVRNQKHNRFGVIEGQGRRVAKAPYAAMELLGQRWVLRIAWELEPGPLGFLELRRRMGNCSSSVLAERMAGLVGAGIVSKGDDGSYELTPAMGHELCDALEAVWSWSDRWSDRLPSPRVDRGSDQARRN
jgi:DNA-binding HxlR family transcriptional regulator